MTKRDLMRGCVWVCLFSAAALSARSSAQSSANEWTWMAGNGSGQQSGVYGTAGTPAAGNLPGSRVSATSWTDSGGNLWLFGGNGIDAGGNSGDLNDLWKYSPSTNQWEWMGGSSMITGIGQPGVYGMVGMPATGNIPGSRVNAAAWTDSSGMLWLFGGEGLVTASSGGWLNDLWQFNPSTNLWAWMGGSDTLDSACAASTSCAPAGVYGTLNTPSAQNVPGGRVGALAWSDSAGNLWLFGGFGSDAGNLIGDLNDLWEFSPSTGEWAWISGSSTLVGNNLGQPGDYGTLGTPAAGNTPGGRADAVTWTDSSGHLWLFGGSATEFNGPQNADLNDLWEFNPTAKQWAWMGGSSAVTCVPGNQGFCGQAGVYGTLGTAAATNIPGGRSNASSWTDKGGNFWLFGGDGFDANGIFGLLNDLWEFIPSQKTWAWVGGSSTIPGYDQDQAGVYGTLGVAASGNAPGGRSGAISWTDGIGNLWLFGGNTLNPNGFSLLLNDLWTYEPYPVTAMPAFSVATGNYNATQTVTISDPTPGSIIYYTTNGSMPTTSSTVYTGPITVSSTETLEAIATAPGDSVSAIATATYTILPSADFSLAASPTSLTVTAGQSGTTTISVTPANGFNAAVSFGCSGLPAGASCSFSPASVTPSATAASTTLTLTTSAAAAARSSRRNPFFPESMLAVAACCIGWRKRRWLQMLLIWTVSAAGLMLLSGCGSGGASKNPPPVTSTVTVTATAGSLQHTTTLLLTVNY